MNLTEHFRKEEFEKRDPIPAALVHVFVNLALMLEAVREQWGPLRITSGYRSPEHNAAINGSKTSQHIATENHCAVDFQPTREGVTVVDVFNWIRLRAPHIRFDQCILEYGPAVDSTTDDCLHLSWSTTPRRIAMIGATNNRAPYVKVEVV